MVKFRLSTTVASVTMPAYMALGMGLGFVLVALVCSVFSLLN